MYHARARAVNVGTRVRISRRLLPCRWRSAESSTSASTHVRQSCIISKMRAELMLPRPLHPAAMLGKANPPRPGGAGPPLDGVVGAGERGGREIVAGDAWNRLGVSCSGGAGAGRAREFAVSAMAANARCGLPTLLTRLASCIELKVLPVPPAPGLSGSGLSVRRT